MDSKKVVSAGVVELGITNACSANEKMLKADNSARIMLARLVCKEKSENT